MCISTEESPQEGSVSVGVLTSRLLLRDDDTTVKVVDELEQLVGETCDPCADLDTGETSGRLKRQPAPRLSVQEGLQETFGWLYQADNEKAVYDVFEKLERTILEAGKMVINGSWHVLETKKVLACLSDLLRKRRFQRVRHGQG